MNPRVRLETPLNESRSVRANAKINLSLKIAGRLKQGLHLLRSAICPISLADEVRITVSSEPGIRLRTDLSNQFVIHQTAVINRFPETQAAFSALDSPKNLALQAASAFVEHYELDLQSFGLEINLLKRIPLQAGLGGGSSDAAAVLHALQSLWALNDHSEMMKLSGRLGADIPALYCGRLCLVIGTGRNVIPLESDQVGIERELGGLGLVIVKPLGGISTASAYAGLGYAPEWELQLDDSGLLTDPFAVSEQLAQGLQEVMPLGLGLSDDTSKLTLLQREGSSGVPRGLGGRTGFLSVFVNDFEKSVVPGNSELELCFDMLKRCGAAGAILAGSGSAVAGFFADQVSAESAANRLKHELDKGWYICQTALLPYT